MPPPASLAAVVSGVGFAIRPLSNSFQAVARAVAVSLLKMEAEMREYFAERRHLLRRRRRRFSSRGGNESAGKAFSSSTGREREIRARERRRRRWPQATTTSPSGVRVHPRANIYAPECRWLKYVLNKGNRAAASPYGLHHVGEWYMVVTGDIFIFLPRPLPTEMRGRESQSYSAMKPSMRGGSGRSRSASARNVSRSFPSSS